MTVKMNLRLLTKNHAADPEIGFLAKSISKFNGCATAMPTVWKLTYGSPLSEEFSVTIPHCPKLTFQIHLPFCLEVKTSTNGYRKKVLPNLTLVHKGRDSLTLMNKIFVAN